MRERVCACRDSLEGGGDMMPPHPRIAPTPKNCHVGNVRLTKLLQYGKLLVCVVKSKENILNEK